MTRRRTAVQATYRPYSRVHTADDVADALGDYRSAYGADPRAIVLGAACGLDAVDGVPVVVDATVALPAGYAYLEICA